MTNNISQTHSPLEFNEQFTLAYNLLENTSEHLFITGKAGTGKSTLLKFFRDNTAKNVVILAPTGVAAVNVQGQTIHSFFRFKPDITPEGVESIRIRRNDQALYRKVDTLIIDEASMLRSDLLDCIEAFLRIYGKDPSRSFGGVQLILIGDLYQLPPVVTRHDREAFAGMYESPYFFDAKSYKPLAIRTIELTKIYRQKEEEFIHLLSTIRDRTATPEHLKSINKRYLPEFVPDEGDFYIYLTTTNALADQINQERLKQLSTKSFVSSGTVTGEFDDKGLPTHRALELKVGAQVMLLNNDAEGRWINGTIGKITYLNEEGFGTDAIEVELDNGEVVDVTPFTWEMYQFFYNQDTERLESREIGSFKQYPLRPAWAVTIHKSQGKTFTRVVVDVGYGTFAHGQLYVALSRCTTLEGIVLKKPIRKEHILLDQRVVSFLNRALAMKEELVIVSSTREGL
jgi:ATP-dependent exoDNAse (exonuclease V) alpha subunit